METLGERLKFIRKKRKLNQVELSQQCGTSQQLISRLENNLTETTNEIFNLAEVLSVEARWLVTGQGQMELPRHSSEDKKILELLNSLTLGQKHEFIEMLEKQKKENEKIIQELSS